MVKIQKSQGKIMINGKRLIETFKELVSLDSPSLDERLVCDYVKEYLASLGITAEEDGAGEKIGGTTGNLYAFVEGNTDCEPILFSAHMDTVTPALGKKAIEHADGTITSDGTTVLGSDDLAGVASILEALRTIKESNTPHRPLELEFSVSEESHCGGIAYFDFDRVRSRDAYVFDMDGAVGTAASSAPAIISYTAEFIGKAAHAGFASSEGIHAIKAAAKAVTLIPCGDIEKGITANVGIIEGGKATNIVPPYCKIVGEIRSFEEEKAFARLDEVKAICEKCADEIGASVNFKGEKVISAFDTKDETSVVRRFKRCCKKLSLSGETYPTFGGSDNNVFCEHGIQGIVVATAMNNCHATDEFTTVDEMTRASELAYELMTSAD